MGKGMAVKSDAEWKAFVRVFKSEMAAPPPARTPELLAKLSHDANFSNRRLLRKGGALTSLRASRTPARARR